MRIFSIKWIGLFLVILPYIGFSQNEKPTMSIDQSFKDIKILPDDTAKVEKLIMLYKKSIRERKIRKDILEEALRISEQIYYIDGIAKCYNRMGIQARYENNYSQSVTYHKRALNYFEKSTDTLSKIKCLNSLGVTYRKLNLEKDAFKYYFQALNLSEKINNRKSIAIALHGIGNVYLNTEQYDEALHYFRKALEVETNAKNFKGQEYGLANIGEVFLRKKQYDSAKVYFEKSFQLAKKYPKKEGLAIKYNLLALLAQKEGKYQESTQLYKKAIPLLTKYNNLRYLSNTLINIGINQLHTRQYNEAYSNIRQGLKNALHIHSKENITLGYDALTKYYTLTKNFEKALQTNIKASKFHDSIVNIESQRSIISTQIEYETQKKDEQIKKLAQEKEKSLSQAHTSFINLLIAGSISLSVIVGLIYVIFLLRKNKELVLEKKNSEIKNYLEEIHQLQNSVQHTSQNFLNGTSKISKEFDLSKRETEVLQYIVEGYSNEQISEKLFVSKNTIKTHIKNIYSKLDVKNRIQVVNKISHS